MAKPEVGIKPDPPAKLPVFIVLSFVSGFVGFLPVGLLFNRLWVPLVLSFVGVVIFILQSQSCQLPVKTSLGIRMVEFFSRRFAERLTLFNEERMASLLKERLALGTLIQPSRFPNEAQDAVRAAATEHLSLGDLRQEPEKINRLIGIILGVTGYLRKKINETLWPANWKTARMSGLTNDADASARELINDSINQGRIPGQGNLTALGSLLSILLHDLGG